jgi:hypothetical protein
MVVEIHKWFLLDEECTNEIMIMHTPQCKKKVVREACQYTIIIN